MAIKKRILFRITSSNHADKLQELITLIKSIDDNCFELSILFTYKNDRILQYIPADVDVIFLVKHHTTIDKNFAFGWFRTLISFLQLQLYHYFPSCIQHKIRKIPDIEIGFNQASLRGLLKSPFKSSKKVFWFDEDIKNDYTSDYGRGLIRMISRCNVTVFGSLYAREAFENHFGLKIPRSLYIYPYINKNQVLELSSQKSLLLEDQFSGGYESFCIRRKSYIR